MNNTTIITIRIDSLYKKKNTLIEKRENEVESPESLWVLRSSWRGKVERSSGDQKQTNEQKIDQTRQNEGYGRYVCNSTLSVGLLRKMKRGSNLRQ